MSDQETDSEPGAAQNAATAEPAKQAGLTAGQANQDTARTGQANPATPTAGQAKQAGVTGGHANRDTATAGQAGRNTVPAEQAKSADAIREARRMSFNTDAQTYRRGRPPYPAAVFELLAERCGLGPGARVLEIGAGTGLATGPLLAAGARVVAVEPGENLAGVLAAEQAGDRLEIAVADFETVDLPGGFDLAVAATALHWLDPATSTAKIGALVRPGGWLAAWWNEFGDVKRPTLFRDRLDEVYHDLLSGETGYRNSRSHVLDTDRWRGQLTAGGYFGSVSVEIIEWEQILTAQSARDLWSTFPNIGELDPPKHEEFLSRLGALVDELGGRVADPRLTVVYTAQRVAD